MKKKKEFELARRQSFVEKSHRENIMYEKQIKLSALEAKRRTKTKTSGRAKKLELPEQTEKIKVGAQHHINRILNSKGSS